MILYDVSGRVKDEGLNSRGISSYADLYGVNLSNLNLTGDAVNRNIWYGAGVCNTNNLLWSTKSANNACWAYPIFAPYRGGVISGIAISVARLAVADPDPSVFRFGIYANSGVDMLYPSRILVQSSGEYSPNLSGVYKYPITLEMEPGGLYWLVGFMPQAINVQFRGGAVIGMQNLLGFDSEFNANSAVGWFHTVSGSPGFFNQNFNLESNLPTVFPTGASLLTNPPFPIFFYSFSR